MNALLQHIVWFESKDPNLIRIQLEMTTALCEFIFMDAVMLRTSLQRVIIIQVFDHAYITYRLLVSFNSCYQMNSV